ncbi:hypothetical protein [Brevundimonas sp.]|uniref:hypothetical protein n=1 Tax=Brevundimonas sp. TaxID=1871086 RepID=UPI00356317E1
MTVFHQAELTSFDRIQVQIALKRRLREIEARHPHLDASLLLVLVALAEFAANQDAKAGRT